VFRSRWHTRHSRRVALDWPAAESTLDGMELTRTAGFIVDLLNASTAHHLHDLDGLVRLAGGRLGRGSTAVVVGRLVDDGLVHERTDRRYTLTPEGRDVAVRRAALGLA